MPLPEVERRSVSVLGMKLKNYYSLELYAGLNDGDCLYGTDVFLFVQSSGIPASVALECWDRRWIGDRCGKLFNLLRGNGFPLYRVEH